MSRGGLTVLVGAPGAGKSTAAGRYHGTVLSGFRYVQVLDQYGVVVATYTHGGPSGVGVCPECTADATAVAQ